jgi:hypothetical protein
MKMLAKKYFNDKALIHVKQFKKPDLSREHINMRKSALGNRECHEWLATISFTLNQGDQLWLLHWIKTRNEDEWGRNGWG